MLTDRRTVLAATLAMACPVPAIAVGTRVFTPEEFGAKGDGCTNDSLALARLAAAVNLFGGGTVVFRRTTYLVGAQGLGTGSYLFPPRDLLAFKGCRLPLELRGNAARLLCEPGLRYGVFDADARPIQHPMPYLGPGLATPYTAMVSVENCTGAVRIADLELAGCTDQLVIGGQYGDTGWQIPGGGLYLRDNRGSEVIERVRAHHHPQDGIQINGLDADTPGVVRAMTDVVADANGRQGLSLVGGRGWRFARCSFTRTGRGKVSSAPGAGVDIEAEGGKRVRDLVFTACRFADNAGCGMVADTGDSDGARFVACDFVGTTNWSAWPNKPHFRFDRCRFTGALVRAYGDPDPARAAQFVGCSFDDDPARSPTRKVYGGENRDRPLADLSDARNVLFDRCGFTALTGVLPWSTGAIYRNCTMVQGTRTSGFPRGRFEGRNTIRGKVDLYGSTITGTLLVNGAPVH